MKGMSGHFQTLLRRRVLARIVSHTLAIIHDALLPKMVAGELQVR